MAKSQTVPQANHKSTLRLALSQLPTMHSDPPPRHKCLELWWRHVPCCNTSPAQQNPRFVAPLDLGPGITAVYGSALPGSPGLNVERRSNSNDSHDSGVWFSWSNISSTQLHTNHPIVMLCCKQNQRLCTKLSRPLMLLNWRPSPPNPWAFWWFPASLQDLRTEVQLAAPVSARVAMLENESVTMPLSIW